MVFSIASLTVRLRRKHESSRQMAEPDDVEKPLCVSLLPKQIARPIIAHRRAQRITPFTARRVSVVLDISRAHSPRTSSSSSSRSSESRTSRPSSSRSSESRTSRSSSSRSSKSTSTTTTGSGYRVKKQEPGYGMKNPYPIPAGIPASPPPPYSVLSPTDFNPV